MLLLTLLTEKHAHCIISDFGETGFYPVQGSKPSTLYYLHQTSTNVRHRSSYLAYEINHKIFFYKKA